MALVLIPLLGLLAGLLTTVAGMGGGLVLLGALGLLTDPHQALAWTAPALLLGNLHRLWLYRGLVDRATAGRFALGAIPAAFAGGLVASALPGRVLAGILLVVGAMGLLVHFGRRDWRLPAWSMVPFGALAGGLVATGGGAAVVVGPSLHARGLSGRRYLATMATVAVALHSSRLLAYGLGGMAGLDDLLVGAGLSLCIAVGNLLGDRVIRGWSERALDRVQVGAVLACMGLAVGELW